MNGGRGAGRPRAAVLAVACAGCLTMAGCESVSDGAVPRPAQSPVRYGMQKFCLEVGSAMRAQDHGNVSQDMPLTTARVAIARQTGSVAVGLSALVSHAPRALRPTILGVIAEYRAYQQAADQATSVAQILAAAPRISPPRQADYLRLLAFTSREC
jgi:hypothetical protein